MFDFASRKPAEKKLKDEEICSSYWKYWKVYVSQSIFDEEKLYMLLLFLSFLSLFNYSFILDFGKSFCLILLYFSQTSPVKKLKNWSKNIKKNYR